MHQIESGGIAHRTEVSGSGIQAIIDGGAAYNTILKNGGKQIVTAKGKAYNTTVCKSGILEVDEKGIVSNLTVNAGGKVLLDGGTTLTGKTSLSSATISGETAKTRLALTKNASLVLGANNKMNQINLDASNAGISISGTGNTLRSLVVNKKSTLAYDLNKVAAKSKAYMLTLNTANKQKIGSFRINVGTKQGVGVYELSKNIVQNKNTAYTVYVACKKMKSAKLNGLGLINGTAIYSVSSGSSNTISLTIAKADAKPLKGNDNNNKLKGSSNWNVFYGGKGNDTITGAGGRDVAVYDETNWGKDTIIQASGTMTLLFKDITAKELIQKKSGKNLIITRKNDAKQSVTIQNYNKTSYNLVYNVKMTAFNTYLTKSGLNSSQITAARNEAFKKAGLASA